MNFEYSASRWMEATHTHTHAYPPPTHTHTDARAYVNKQGVTLHILVSSISLEGVVYHHSDVSPDGATAPVHVTLWKDCIAMSMVCCKREPFISFGNIMSFYKFCWSQDMNILKERSVAWDRNWKNGW